MQRSTFIDRRQHDFRNRNEARLPVGGHRRNYTRVVRRSALPRRRARQDPGQQRRRPHLEAPQQSRAREHDQEPRRPWRPSAPERRLHRALARSSSPRTSARGSPPERPATRQAERPRLSPPRLRLDARGGAAARRLERRAEGGVRAAAVEAQDAYYREHYDPATFDVIVVDGEPIGRLYVARWDDEIRIIDITLVPEHRRRGLGTALLRELLDEGARTGKRVASTSRGTTRPCGCTSGSASPLRRTGASTCCSRPLLPSRTRPRTASPTRRGRSAR